MKDKDRLQYVDYSLRGIIKFYIDEALIKKDWECIAIDTKKDKVVFRRFETIEHKTQELK